MAIKIIKRGAVKAPESKEAQDVKEPPQPESTTTEPKTEAQPIPPVREKMGTGMPPMRPKKDLEPCRFCGHSYMYPCHGELECMNRRFVVEHGRIQSRE